MKLRWNVILQSLAMVVQYGNQASGFVPPKYQPWVAGVVGLAQGIIAWRSHYFNPDGTPAAVGYQK